MPNPTGGAGAVTITATAYDGGTGGSTIMAAEWFIGPDPGVGAGTAMSAVDAAFDEVEEGVTAIVTPLPGGDFTVFVRAKDSALNWGPVTSVLVRETAASPGDLVGPETDSLTVTPNPTAGATMVTVKAVAFDTVTGGSTIMQAEAWIGATVIAEGTGTAMLAVDGTFDEVAELVTVDLPVPIVGTAFDVQVRARDSAGNWGPPALTTVLITSAAAGNTGPVFVQCPGDSDGDAVIDLANDPHKGDPGLYSYPTDARCMHISGGDGFVKMADGRDLYIFSFSDLTGTPPDQAIGAGILAANFSAPTIVVDEEDEFHLNLTNVSMMVRADLFDPHTVHWHGFRNAAAIFDGIPDASLAVNMGSTLTYWYRPVDPGTYMWHCHVEATEHMQMGMLGNLYVRPKQNRLPDGWCFATGMVEPPLSCAGHQHSNPDWSADRNVDDPLVGDKYLYNDGDGSTRYDVEYPVQIGSFDPDFHDASEAIQPLPFALMEDRYPMLNGRGYPDTMTLGPVLNLNGYPAQKVHTRIDAGIGEVIALRISNLNVTNFYTLATLGIPMKVVGWNAQLLRGPDGKDLSYTTNSITLGGGESADVLLDVTVVPVGTYFLYTTNLNYLSNNEEDFGGMMTEITIVP
jgi:FtsP/CotA-like multicopper oxidase with cupredoxin domain